jgi:hypothetical protein
VMTPKFSGSTISQTVAFFCAIGLLSRDKGGFVPNVDVIDYNNTRQWDELQGRLKLKPLFEKTWFYRCLVPRLQLSPQPQSTCLAILASESRATPEYEERLIYILRFLELASVLSIAGGTVTLLQHRLDANRPDGMPDAAKASSENKATIASTVTNGVDGDEHHVLYLDKTRKRRVTLHAPLTISKPEYERICKWIQVTLIVEDSGLDLDKRP